MEAIGLGIAIYKLPALQTVDSGSTVTFTITVSNTGDVTLSPVIVTDMLVPDCDKVIASLGAWLAERPEEGMHVD